MIAPEEKPMSRESLAGLDWALVAPERTLDGHALVIKRGSIRQVKGRLGEEHLHSVDRRASQPRPKN